MVLKDAWVMVLAWDLGDAQFLLCDGKPGRVDHRAPSICAVSQRRNRRQTKKNVRVIYRLRSMNRYVLSNARTAKDMMMSVSFVKIILVEDLRTLFLLVLRLTRAVEEREEGERHEQNYRADDDFLGHRLFVCA
jgi:hypothetical protein